MCSRRPQPRTKKLRIDTAKGPSAPCQSCSMVRQALTRKPSNLVDGSKRGNVLFHVIPARTPATLPFALALHIDNDTSKSWKLQIDATEYKEFKNVRPKDVYYAMRYHRRHPGMTRDYDTTMRD
eukprot:GHVU01193471.1.p1 GENE.GHVU01193471.1~~GHVU01193471.1.p1  ORF type:complete len:124 (+),score=5.61 GHVU01193471.1:513-884(+)